MSLRPISEMGSEAANAPGYFPGAVEGWFSGQATDCVICGMHSWSNVSYHSQPHCWRCVKYRVPVEALRAGASPAEKMRIMIEALSGP